MRAILTVRGKTSEWGVTADMSKEQIEEMNADGIHVGILQNSVPMWVVDCGLLQTWCFFQDVWNLRNPFSK
jgi:hypothetical protein